MTMNAASYDMGNIFAAHQVPHDASNLSTMWKQLDLLEQRGVLINELYKQIEILKQENTSLKAQIVSLTEVKSFTLPNLDEIGGISKSLSVATLTKTSTTFPSASVSRPLSPSTSVTPSIAPCQLPSTTTAPAIMPSKIAPAQWTEVITKFHVPLTADSSPHSDHTALAPVPVIAPAATPATQWKEVTTRFQIPTDVLERLHKKPISVITSTLPTSTQSPNIGNIRSPSEYTICAISGISRRNISELKNDLKRGNVDTTKIANIQFTSDSICEVLLLKCYADQFCGIMKSWNFEVLPGGSTLVPPPNCTAIPQFYNNLFRRFKRTISRQSTENITSSCYEFILNEILANNPELQAMYAAFLQTNSF
ncbi:hypothetical protein HDU99_000308 [Rhizoclosmatium hyalinum]|nr:hypothetical protein HDU99_000308 [Rhizoclosmatium hyalinum]